MGEVDSSAVDGVDTALALFDVGVDSLLGECLAAARVAAKI